MTTGMGNMPVASSYKSFALRLLSPFLIDNPADRRLRPTAYLDGLRGFMAFLVYVHHHELWAHDAGFNTDTGIFESGYGYNGKRHFATLPFVRNFFSGGHIAVAVFFVISGYVLAAKPLSLLIDGDFTRMSESIASSFFRRWFRLYMPIFVTTLVYVISWHWPGYWVSNATRQGSLADEIWNWYTESKNLSFIFKEGPIWLTFNRHLWSIPVEMRGSVIVFTAVLALHRAPTKKRLASLAVLTWYNMYIADGYYCSLFTAGTLMCDLDLLRARNHPEYPAFLARLAKHKKGLSMFFMIVGLYLAGVPSQTSDLDNLRNTYGWYYLSWFKPQAVFDYKWFYLFLAAVMIVGSVPHLSIKKFFEGRFCQYLGRVSYALYLVHGPILSSIGDRVYYMFGWVREAEAMRMEYWMYWFPYVKDTGPMGLELSFLVPHIILLPLTFAVANFVTKYVDDYAVAWSNRLFKFVCSDSGSMPPAPPPANGRLA